MTINKAISLLRNPWHKDEEELREARLLAANILEQRIREKQFEIVRRNKWR